MDGISTGESLADLDEISRFGDAVQAFRNLEMDEAKFTSVRLQQGVYGQRQPGLHMVRIKVPGGLVTPGQLEAIADALESYSEHNVAHVTTRTAIQLHYVPLAHTPATLERLARAGLTTREACNNTVRNISACPMAGVCPREHTDVNVHLQAAARHFLRNPLNQQLPRKFKISFSGCESDCGQAMLHDLGVVATWKDGRPGFRILAAGGLGHKPREALVVESFIDEKDLLLSMEALISLHNRYSDRVKRAKARIKFLVDRFGAEGFLEKYREELAHVRAALSTAAHPEGAWVQGGTGDVPGPGAPRALFPQKQAGLMAFSVSLPQGNLTAAQLRGVAAIMTDQGLGRATTTQDQNLVLLDVPAERVARLRPALAALGLGEPVPGDDAVACPGTTTCRLGITSSTVAAPRLQGLAGDLRLRVSGCHNGCAQPETGDIGIYGEGRRLHGKLIPHYQMFFGGDGMAGGALALKGPSVPTRRVETAVTRVGDAFQAERQGDETFFHWVRRVGVAHINAQLADLTVVTPEDIPELGADFGDEGEFRVLQLGGGECAGAMQVQVGSAFFNAAHERRYRDAFYFQRKYGEAAQAGLSIARVIAEGLLDLVKPVRGRKALEDMGLLAAELEGLVPEALTSGLAAFATQTSQDPDTWDEPAAATLSTRVDAWTYQAAEFCLARDAQLDLAGALPGADKAAARPAGSA